MLYVMCQWLFLSCAELGDSVAMSPVDRMRSLSLKLVSLGKIYAGTPRYFPLGKQFYPCVIMFRFCSLLLTVLLTLM